MDVSEKAKRIRFITAMAIIAGVDESEARKRADKIVTRILIEKDSDTLPISCSFFGKCMHEYTTRAQRYFQTISDELFASTWHENETQTGAGLAVLQIVLPVDLPDNFFRFIHEYLAYWLARSQKDVKVEWDTLIA